MKNCLLTLIALVVLLSPATTWTQMVPTATVIMVDTIDCAPGEAFALTIRMENSIVPFAGLQLPLRFDSPYVTIDSVSFVGSVKPSGTTGRAEIDETSDTLGITYYPVFGPTPFATVTESAGILATIHGHVEYGAAPGLISVDSIYHPTQSTNWTGIGFADALGLGLYTPNDFIDGGILVLSPTDVGDSKDAMPTSFGLTQNYPNPFNPVTSIEFSLPTAGPVRFDVFNILGQNVTTLIDKPMSAGHHTVEFDASKQPSGIYFYRLTHTSGSDTRKMVLLK